MITKTCAVSNQEFVITDEDIAYYEKIGVPLPTLCSAERQRRRHGWINDYNFYRRKCDATGHYFIAIYPPTSEYRVFSQSAWYSDKRDDKAEGREFDFNRPFFEQFNELLHAAPQLGIIGMNNENSDYCESVANCKNCYLISESSNCEDCYYSYWIQKCKDSSDLAYCHECELCYECTHCYSCHSLFYSEHCDHCSDSWFLKDCANCRDCIGCTNLCFKQYYIFNKPYSKKEYETLTNGLNLDSRSGIEKLETRCHDFWKTQPARALQVENTENCTGNFIRNAKNCREVYHCYDAEECAYGEHVWRGARYCYDVNTAGRNAELIYESTNSGIDSYNVKFSRYCWGCKDTEYSNQCKNAKDLFGCVSLKPGNQYCILNKQYSREDYFALREKIIAHMKQTGEYGEFFPLSMSLFGYNDSVSGDEMPLPESEAKALGYKWQAPVMTEKYDGPKVSAPDKLSDVPDNICETILTCAATGKQYRITEAELKLYQKLNLPLPDKSFQARFKARLNASWPMKSLITKKCTECGTDTKTAEESQSILCNKCYLNLVQ